MANNQTTPSTGMNQLQPKRVVYSRQSYPARSYGSSNAPLNYRPANNIGAPTGDNFQIPQAYQPNNGDTHDNHIPRYNYYSSLVQVQQSYKFLQAIHPPFVPTCNQAVSSEFRPFPNHSQHRRLAIKAPEDREMRRLGEEDALILLDYRRKIKPETTPIKVTVKELADELSQRSRSTTAQDCRLDRSTGELSSEHEHICPEKMALRSPLCMNIQWTIRDQYTLEYIYTLSQLSKDELLEILGDRTHRIRNQRRKGTLQCDNCEKYRTGQTSSTLQPRIDDSPNTTTKILVGGLPSYATRHDVYILFQPSGLPHNPNFGPIKEIRRKKECTFITFSDRRAAEEAMNKLQGYALDGEGNVRLRLSWGRQQDKQDLKRQ
ncbi:RNA-binding protein [Venturia nashicola]|uniref:RNA-binding protein n=1 Tax=Venturia nashicola TaxID=86259 RepID=A0A4Z1PBY8_9PEZI|nr:RNA-binding protein [Venturia nashicola]TLD29785.1 RNA-binding protein [Venturia nashicola]